MEGERVKIKMGEKAHWGQTKIWALTGNESQTLYLVPMSAESLFHLVSLHCLSFLIHTLADCDDSSFELQIYSAESYCAQ